MMPENGARDLRLRELRLGELQRRLGDLAGCSPPRPSPAPEMKLLFARSTARSYFGRASVRFARACCTSASGIAGSSRTSVAPLATRWPSWKPIALMRPATSGRNGDRFVGAQAADRGDGLRQRSGHDLRWLRRQIAAVAGAPPPLPATLRRTAAPPVAVRVPAASRRLGAEPVCAADPRRRRRSRRNHLQPGFFIGTETV